MQCNQGGGKNFEKKLINAIILKVSANEWYFAIK